MSDPTELNELLEDDEDDPALVKKLRAVIKDQSKELKGLRSETEEFQGKVQEFERASVFDSVGIPADGMGKLFRDSYPGELDQAAVQAAAEEYGLLQPPQPNATPVEQQAHAAIDSATSTPPPAPLGLKEQIEALDPNDPEGLEKLTKLVQGTGIEFIDELGSYSTSD